MSHTNIDDCLTILGLALYQRLEDINVFRMFVKAAEKYYQASHPMHLVLPSAQELSHTAILSIRGPDMPTDAKRYMSMLRKQHILVTREQDNTRFCLEALLGLQSYSHVSQIIGRTLQCQRSVDLHWYIQITASPLVTQAGYLTVRLLICWYVPTDEHAKILSAARFPTIGGAWRENLHSTEYVAWRATEGLPFAEEDIPLPTGEFMFGGAATAGSSILVVLPATWPRDDTESQDWRTNFGHRKAPNPLRG